MPLALVLACLWIVAACGAGMAPTRFHWPAAWGLIAAGIPLLGFLTFTMGPVWGLVGMAAGASILRWPVLRAGQRIAGLLAPRDGTHGIGHRGE
jgi:hypothetical protein